MATRVVIAEDEAIIRLDLKETLEEEGYEVVGETGRGDEAVKLVRELEPDLAILDIKMPGLDGLAAAGDRGRAPGGAHPHSVQPATSSSRPETPAPWRTSSSRSSAASWCRRSRWRSGGSRIRALADQTASLEEQLETRKVVDRAKGKLMDEEGMGESEAFGFIQRRAMSERVTMRPSPSASSTATSPGMTRATVVRPWGAGRPDSRPRVLLLGTWPTTPSS